ncbi:MAG: cupin domain-containing protein [Bacteroidales bacterium]|nr:cupin domain-containing protein [Bacteroidales bacterium]
MKVKVKKPSSEEIREASSWGIWSREPSEFPWYYDDKETCYILEGKATVTDARGRSISFAEGDWVEFETGLECTWKIEKAIRKRYKFG